MLKQADQGNANGNGEIQKSSSISYWLWIALAGLLLLAAAKVAYDFYQGSRPNKTSRGSKAQCKASESVDASDHSKFCTLKRAGAFGALIAAVATAGYCYKSNCDAKAAAAEQERIDEEARLLAEQEANSSFFRRSNPWAWLSGCVIGCVITPTVAFATRLMVGKSFGKEDTVFYQWGPPECILKLIGKEEKCKKWPSIFFCYLWVGIQMPFKLTCSAIMWCYRKISCCSSEQTNNSNCRRARWCRRVKSRDLDDVCTCVRDDPRNSPV